MSEKKAWKTYEEVATYLLNEFAEHFGLECVEGKQSVPGNKSGTNYEIDAKGVMKNGEGFLVVECRRYTTSRLNQEEMGGLAYRIHQDIGAQGGIILSPLELQTGAKKVAACENIHHVILDQNSTTSQYVLRFLNKVFVGVEVTAGVHVTGRARAFSADEAKAIEALPQAEFEAFIRNL